MKKLLWNNEASAVPVILFCMTIVICGALYTFFFTQMGIPIFYSYVEPSDSKTFIMMCIYAMPLFVLVVGAVSLIRSGLKRGVFQLRFNIAALFFICVGFGFFVCWAVLSFMLDTIADVLVPDANPSAVAIIEQLPVAFGIICAIFFVTGILLIFVLDSLADEPEMYWRRQFYA